MTEIKSLLIKQRRTALKLTQQEAAQRARISIASWRRAEGDPTANVGAETVKQIEKVLLLPPGGFEELRSGQKAVSDFPLKVSKTNDDDAARYNKAFARTDDDDDQPLTPRMAAQLATTADLAWEAWTSVEREEIATGHEFIWDNSLLPGASLAFYQQINLVWLERLARTYCELRDRLDAGEVPYPRHMADEIVLWQALSNTEDFIESGDYAEEHWKEFDAYPHLDYSIDLLRDVLFEDTDFLFIFNDQAQLLSDPNSFWNPFR